MLDQAFFPSPVREEKQIKKYREYDINVGILEDFLKGEIVRPTWDHREVGSLYSVCSNTERWKNMHPNQSMSFCKCGRIALQNINRKYGKGMDIAAYHFPGLKQSVVNKGYGWDPGF